MNWLFNLYQSNPTAQAIIVLSIVCVMGMTLGSFKICGVGLGASGVLFAGILAGYFSQPIDNKTLEFVKEFGLALFVFCIGLQLGPGFFVSLRAAGLRSNALAVAVVMLGVLFVVVFGRIFRIDNMALSGLYAGAVQNMPALGAAQQALVSIPNILNDQAALPAAACAIAYPISIIGVLGSLLALKALFRINMAQEIQAYVNTHKHPADPLERRALIVENPNLEGVAIAGVPGMLETGVVISRVRRMRADEVATAVGTTILHVGDTILAIGTPQGLDQLQRIVGTVSHENLLAVSGAVSFRRIFLTNKAILGRTVKELDLEVLHGATITRVARGDIEMVALPSLRLQFGDTLRVVGSEKALDEAAQHLGNSLRALNETQFVPLFAGIAVGVALGAMPIAWPGIPQPLRVGLAGGALIIAILVGRVGRIGRLVWHMPRNANLAFREFGIALFFASVGLAAGPKFFSTIGSPTGLVWLGCGACVSVLPVMVVGVFARVFLSMNYIVLSGLLAGSMTSPPALTLANTTCQSEDPAVAYATVYPLTMLLRIATAQVLAIMLCG